MPEQPHVQGIVDSGGQKAGNIYPNHEMPFLFVFVGSRANRM